MKRAVQMALLGLLASSCGGEAASTPAAANATVVHAVRAQRRDVSAWVFGQGTATAVRRKALYFQVEGKVSYVARGPDGGELRVGDPVSGPRDEELLGQLVAKVDDRDQLASIELNRAELRRSQKQRLSTEAQLKSSAAELDAARRDLKRTEDLIASGAIGKQELDDAKTRVRTADAAVASARSQLGASRSGATAQAAQLRRSEVAHERAAVFAPYDGIIAALNVKEGDYYLGARASTDPGEQLRTAPIVVIDPSQFEIKVELPEFEASRVEPGQTAFILTGEDIATLSVGSDDPAASPENLLTSGVVFAVSPSVDPTARSIEVTIRVSERPERLRDGEFASAYIMADEAKDAVAIPYGAYIREDDITFAFVVPQGSDAAQRRALTLGLSGVEVVEVKKGVEAGELVVTRGRRSLGDGSKVDLAEIEEPPPAAGPDADGAPTEAGG